MQIKEENNHLQHNSTAMKTLWSRNYYLFPEQHNNFVTLNDPPLLQRIAEDTLINLLHSCLETARKQRSFWY